MSTAEKIFFYFNNPYSSLSISMQIIETIPIIVEPNKYNERYLKTKQDRMGHNLHIEK